MLPPILVAAAFLSSGCAKPDWIQQTLVTADVTGVWKGSMGKGMLSAEVWLELKQEGPKVRGSFLPLLSSQGGFVYREGPIDGTVRGDTFTFGVTNGPIVGEATVKGDEMEGYAITGNRSAFSARRVDSPFPRSPKQ